MVEKVRVVLVALLFLSACKVDTRVGVDISADMGGADVAQDQGCATSGCQTGQICVAGACCNEQRACGDTCCGDGLVCSFQTCVHPGATCTHSTECAADEYCAVTSLVSANEICTAPERHCLPKPPTCVAGQTENCVQACQQTVTPTFDPVVKYSWPADVNMAVDHHPYDTMMTPLVIQLSDTDCDGQITSMDRSSIVVTMFQDGGWQGSGVMRALTIKDGTLQELWKVPNVFPGGGLAGGDLDGQNGNEIVACGPNGTSVYAYHGDGSLFWGPVNIGCYNPAIADLDGDGVPEVIVGTGILNGDTGMIKSMFSPAPTGFFTVGDLDSDGKPDIVFENAAYDASGTRIVDLTAEFPAAQYSWVTLIDFDLDGKPEVIGSHYDNDTVVVWRYDAAQPSHFTVIRAPFKADVNPGGSWGWSSGMGSITAGDFNGDGYPDAGFVGFRGYVVLSGKKLMDMTAPSTLAGVSLWSHATDEDNGSTGSALFDFDGDGTVEVLYNDTQRVHIYHGASGDDEATPICNTTGSLFEYPVVADVDGDGEADIVVVSNAFSAHPTNDPTVAPTYTCDGTIQSGVRVLGSKTKGWVQTRSIWNEHTYHVTNVNDDGTIPKQEVSNWTVPGLNNYRQNKQVGGEFGETDATVAVLPSCSNPFGVRVVVTNLGSAPMPAGVNVDVYRDDTPTAKLLGSVQTQYSLFPLQTETLFLAVAAPNDKDLSTGAVTVHAVVDATMTLRECRTDNNQSPATNVACPIF